MPNPIADSTTTLLAELDLADREHADEELLRASLRPPGRHLGLAVELNLFKAIKCVAAVDGLSREELTGLKYLMIMAGLTPPMQRHVQGFASEGIGVDMVAELFPLGSRLACEVLSGAVTVSAIDGLSEEEEIYARELGRALGLSDKLVGVMIAEARATGLAMHDGHQGLVTELIKLRHTIHALVGE